MDSLPELCRIIKTDGKIIFLIAQDMYEDIKNYMIKSGFAMINDFVLRRHGKLISRVLRFERIGF